MIPLPRDHAPTTIRTPVLALGLSAALSAALTLGSCAATPADAASRMGPQAEGRGQSLLIESVRIVDPESDGPSELTCVLIENGRITGIGPKESLPIPRDVPQLHGEGRFLAPGFYDMHAHLPGVDSSLPPEFLGPALDMMLDAGITTARVARGVEGLLAAAKAQEAGTLAGPRLSIAAPALSRNRFPDPEYAGELFANWKDQGYAAIKFLSGPEGVDYGAYADAAQGAGLPWYGHLPAAEGDVPGLALCDHPNQVSVEHASALTREFDRDPSAFKESLRALGQAGVFVCPDVDFYYVGSDMVSLEELLERPGIRELPEATVSDWTAARRLPNPMRAANSRLVETFDRLAPLLRDANVRLLLSASDSHFIVPGTSYAAEVRHMERAGYSPKEIFRMATIHGAECLGESDERGRVQPGFWADLVILEENPIETCSAYRSVAHVIQDGKLVRTARD